MEGNIEIERERGGGELGSIELPTGRDNKLTEQTTKPNQSRAAPSSPSQTDNC